MRVVVGSPNPVKIGAVLDAFSKYYKVEVFSVNVSSGVKAFPDSEELIYQGAWNRAKRAYSDGFDYSVGIEGGVVFFEGRWYDRNYVVVFDDENMGIGTSSAYEVPAHLVEGIDSTTDESKKIIDESLGVEDVFTKQGGIGVLTRGEIERRGLLADAVVCALTPFLNPDYYRDT
jgi:inosine/xanthosine triphosphatase